MQMLGGEGVSASEKFTVRLLRLQGRVLVRASAGAQQGTSLGISLAEMLLVLQILKVILAQCLRQTGLNICVIIVKHLLKCK